MSFKNTIHNILFLIIIFIANISKPVATAYVINSNAFSASAIATASHLHHHQQQYYDHPTSALASKVIFQSPSVAANIYNEMIVSSKPLNVRKYSSGLKTKKTKKDSKIYFIPIPPMPYRYIPGVGYDYQPMKINPIMGGAPPSVGMVDAPNHIGSSFQMGGINSYGGIKHQQKQQHKQHHKPQQHYPKYPSTATTTTTAQSMVNKEVNGVADDSITNVATSASSDSKVFHMQRRNYYFNGRPIRLQVAHAHASKHRLTPQNLKSKFYFNKKIIF